MKKYNKGAQIYSLDYLMFLINNEENFYHNHKFQHYKFVENWSLKYLTKEIKAGNLFEADKI